MAAADRPDELHPGSEDLDGADHPCAVLLHEAANGRFPPADGNVEFFAPDDFGTCAAVGFTGHAVVLTPPGPRPERPSAPFGFGGVHEPNFLLSLAGPGGELGSLDVVLVARGTGRAGPTERSPERLTETDAHDRHPRVLRARSHRRHVRVLGDERGLVAIGVGLVGRTELSVELTGAAPGRGVGRQLIRGGLAAVGRGQLVFAQVAAGNAASLRAFLACGFVPVASEVLIVRATPDADRRIEDR
ncbi:MAG: hypothetical protein R2715_16950 [Ilumatobacteraceae bacterium]